MKNKVRRYLTILGVLVSVVLIGALGAVALANPGEVNVSNQLTLVGNSAPAMITLEWAGVAGGSVAGSAATVVWYNGVSYLVSVKATNTTTQPITGVYGKLTGWDKAKVKIEFLNTAMGADHWTDLGKGDVEAGYCGFFVDGVYYFGPHPDGDSYAAGHTATFAFKMTPLVAGNINVALVLVNGVTDPR